MSERITIVPFDEGHLDGAAALLAERHQAQRRVEPGLDPAYEDPATARADPTIVTDWRMTNLLASRTWPRLGFRPTFYRLFRAIA